MSFGKNRDDSVGLGRSRWFRPQPDGPRRAAVALLAVLCFAAAAGAQDVGGALSGTISDAQQGILPGVGVTLVNESTNATLQTTTNERGAYVFPFGA